MPASDRLWKPFIIPQHLLKEPYLTSSPLFHLPIEIICLIFEHTDLVTQFALALSCKTLLQISTRITFKSSLFVNQPISNQSLIVEQLLRRLKLLTPTGRPKKAWKLCVDCLQYRPTRISYWKKKGHLCDQFMIDWAAFKWSGNGCSMQCPECKDLERKALQRAWALYSGV